MITLADDLTGACDVGAEFLRNNWPVRCVFASARGWRESLEKTRREAVVLDMETRRLPPAKAARRAGEIGMDLRQRGLSPAYFKIDSTLRGNLYREIEAVRRASRKRLAWLVPANPSMGRWTIGGRHFVDGIRIEKTPFARDPLHPVRSGDLLAAGNASLGPDRCVLLGLGDLSRGPRHLRRLRNVWLRKGARMVVADAVCDDDLRRVAECIPKEDLACGAASLARHCTPVRKGARRAGTQRMLGRGLAVIGSLNPVTARQVDRASRKRGIEVRRLGPGDLRQSPAAPGPGTRWLVLALAAGKFRLARSPDLAARAGENIAVALARYSARAFEAWKPRKLLFSGGLTAAAVSEQLGIRELVLVRELAPGLVLSEAISERGRYSAITKPGGFGAANSLERLMG